jgi:Arc/MetJ family transcription regulator
VWHIVQNAFVATNLALDDKLVAAAKRLGRHASKRAAVNEALAEYVARRRQKTITELFGEVDWDPEYDYKAERKRR